MSYLLKGLDLVCRFRFMFLESDSEFSDQNILATRVERLPELAHRLLKELNLLQRDSRDAGLDQPKVWRNFISWDHIRKMSAEYLPREAKIREIVAKIAVANGQRATLTPLREELASALEEMENAIRPENALLVREMARRLQKMVQDDDNEITEAA
ncbi:MAG: hypothetical protein JO356_06820 [Acidobacteria bacterium]|nr:hypothetical protein [Acidobacteriota bacterium]